MNNNIELKKRLLTLMTIPLISLSVSKNIENFKEDQLKENNLEYSSETKTKSITTEYIGELINQNPNLSFEEKIFLYDTKVILLENIDYINIPQVEKFLSTVSLNYNYVEDGINGVYNDTEKLMEIIYDELSPEAYSTLLHEILHGYTLNFTYSSYYLNEIYNEICKKEYCEEVGIKSFTSGYENDLIIGYILEEIIGNEIIRYYKFNADFNIIKKSLINIGVTETDVDLFYKELAALHIFSKRQIHQYDVREDTYIRIFDLLSKFYAIKYNEDILENIELLYILENTVLEIPKVSEKLNQYADNSVYYYGNYSLSDEIYSYSEEDFEVYYKEMFNNTKGNEDYKFYYYNHEMIINNNLKVNEGFETFKNNIVETIENNKNISDSEKYIIDKSVVYIHNYFDKLDVESILDVMENLEIIYSKSNEDSYFDKDNHIIYINREESEADDVIIFLELLKVYTNKTETYSKYVYSIANEMFLSEYKRRISMYDKNIDLFEHDLHIAYFMYELLGEEFLYEYNFYPSSKTLEDKFISVGLTDEEINTLLLYLHELETVKYLENNQEEIEKLIYKFWEFTKAIRNDNLIVSSKKERAAFLAMRRIEVNYKIKSTGTVELEDENYFLDDVDIFEDYSTNRNTLFEIRIRK